MQLASLTFGLIDSRLKAIALLAVTPAARLTTPLAFLMLSCAWGAGNPHTSNGWVGKSVGLGPLVNRGGQAGIARHSRDSTCEKGCGALALGPWLDAVLVGNSGSDFPAAGSLILRFVGILALIGALVPTARRCCTPPREWNAPYCNAFAVDVRFRPRSPIGANFHPFFGVRPCSRRNLAR